MPLEVNFNALLGASLLGVVAAATCYFVEHYRQERKRHTMAQDLARMDTELSILRRELDQILALQRDKPSKARRNRNKDSVKKADSVISQSTTTEDYTSALDLDSSDLEFYDLSDDDVDVLPQLQDSLNKIDEVLDRGNASEIENCLTKLSDLCLEQPQDPQLLWRIAKAHHKLFEKTDDETVMQQHINKGIEACKSALKMTPELCEVHKWLAILIGCRTDFQPQKEKISDGHLFKKHVDRAIVLNPTDPPLHHMLGRFSYEIASLKWYERKVAAALFGEPPNATYEEALEHFLEAEKLSKHNWKENKLCVAKCKAKLGLTDDAVHWLIEADAITTNNNSKVDAEVKDLLEKYTTS